MFAIETELGRFEGETEKAAKKALRKAEKANRAEQKRRSDLSNVAMMRARANGFRILSFVLTKETMPNGWMFHAPSEPHLPIKVGAALRHGISRAYPSVTFEGEHGKAEAEFYGFEFIGVVLNGAGYPIAFFLRDMTTNAIDAYAVGIEQDVVAWDALPTITPEHFRTSRHAQSA